MATGTIERAVDIPVAKSPYRKRRWIFFSLLLAAVVGVAAAVTARPDRAILVSNGAGEISLVDSRTGEARYTVNNAVRAPAGENIYRAETKDDTTIVEVLDPDSGTVLTSTNVGGDLEIRAVSPLGGAVALMTPRPNSADLYVPEPREATSINIVWSDGRPTRNYSLTGNFEPETFSTDEKTLFLLEFYPALAPDRYFVRQLDLGSGEVSAVTTPDQQLGIELNPEMRGHARAQAMAPDGSFLFSLYTIASGEEPVHDPAAPSEDRWAFVHTLNLKEKWSHCIFLPLPFGTVAESALSLGMATDGSDLFVIDAGTEHVARIDARNLYVEKVEKIPGLGYPTARPLAVGPEIVYIGLDWSVLEMGRDNLIPNAAFVVNDVSGNLPITGLELATDGRTLRIAHGASISVLDMPTEKIIATLTSPGKSSDPFVGDPVGERVGLDLVWVIPGS